MAGERLQISEQEIAELARRIHEEGMGILTGVLSNDPVNDDCEVREGFLMGEDVSEVDIDTLRQLQETVAGTSYFDEITGTIRPRDIQHGKNTHQQVLLIDDYLFRPVSPGRSAGWEESKPFQGKAGGPDWIKYTYYQPVRGRRAGSFLNFIFTVPPDLAREIDRASESNPLLPDMLQRALFPDIGERTQRVPAIELLVIDRRGSQRKSPVETRTQIEYAAPLI